MAAITKYGKNLGMQVPSLAGPHQDCSKNSDLSKNMVASGWGILLLYAYLVIFTR